MNEHFQLLRAGCLRVSIINEFIEELIHEHEVLLQRWFVEHAAVVFDHLHAPLQELHAEAGRDIQSRAATQQQAAHFDMDIVDTFHDEYRRRFFSLESPELDFAEEGFRRGPRHIMSVISPDDCISSGAQNEDL